MGQFIQVRSLSYSVGSRAQLFRVEVARLEEPVHAMDFRQSFIARLIRDEINSRLKSPPVAGIEPRSPLDEILRSECSSTVLAGPGSFPEMLTAVFKIFCEVAVLCTSLSIQVKYVTKKFCIV